MTKQLRVLIGCEFSGTVRRAFTRLGHDAWSCDLLPAADGSNKHYVGDVRNYLHLGWDLMVAHPPCFTAETLILTRRGYVPICEVVVGDMVLTHKGRWRRVKERMVKTSEGVVAVKSSNCLETITTAEHPYFARYREPYRNGFRTMGKRNGPAKFIAAGDLTGRHFTASVLPPVEPCNVSDADLWLMGRYVADGHMRESRWTPGKYEEMVISVGRAKLDAFKAKVERKVTLYESETAIKAIFYGHDTIAPFAQFGRGAANKSLPAWVLALPREQAAIFLDGYLSGDGSSDARHLSASSVSRALILGIGALMQRVHGKCPAFRSQAPRVCVEIEGRTVNTLPLHTVEIPHAEFRLRNYVEGDTAWGRVRYATPRNELVVVYNLSVEEDETYTANGVAVHNCTRLCNSGVRWLSEPPGKLTAEHYSRAEIEAYRLMGRDARLAFMWAKLDEGAKLFSDLWNAPIERIAIENPVMHQHAKSRIRNYQEFGQSVQPWQFGDWETKRTCLWLRNLPTLTPTYSTLDEARRGLGLAVDAKPDNRVHAATPGPDRWKIRSKFFEGIARAMATQWGGYADELERITA